ncbi:PIN2/TERF1-interacting telomerase inhibitor 1 isoform X2 [Carcharodon carcharias]|uniref:PIN2/TERF1-interacting telomerase inhibitor 1 isoform X2 n=1 Tax=Carcharodon carcharias TaxID=13397 RepID=UPI001B7F75AB|nr:PIN2/TERF1-interacting telomerase inhibitor 1 isoform X2 [Carcharodon carcharias]
MAPASATGMTLLGEGTSPRQTANDNAQAYLKRPAQFNDYDNWIAHQDEFNQLLSELNDCHGQNGSPVAEDKTTFSLEEKSKSSKKRVHYQKFTKGKDLSSRSSTDLACIFGKRSQRVRGSRDQEEQVKDDACLVPVGDPKAASAPEPKVEINTVTSSLTMQEYFANRMAQLKKPKAVHEIHQTSAAQELEGDDLISSKEAKTKSKKKKKRSRSDAERICNFDQLSIPTKQATSEGDVEVNNGLTEESPIKENYQTKKKSKKSRTKHSVSLNQKICPLEVESEEVQVEQYSAVNELSEEQNEQDWEEDKKKQKKIKKKATPMGEDEVSQACRSIERRRKKKEKK